MKRNKIKIYALTRSELETVRSEANFTADQDAVFDALNKDQYFDFAIMQDLGLSPRRYYEIKRTVLEKVERIVVLLGYNHAIRKPQ